MRKKSHSSENQIRPKNRTNSKSNTKAGSSDTQQTGSNVVEKLEKYLCKVKNGKIYRAMLAEIETKPSNTLEAINLYYKDKNVVKSCKRRESSKKFNFKKPLTADLKRGVFSLKQSIMRPKTPNSRATFTNSCNWKKEVKFPTEGSAFVFVPVFQNTLATFQDTENYEHHQESEVKLTPWQQLMRDFDIERKKVSNKICLEAT